MPEPTSTAAGVLTVATGTAAALDVPVAPATAATAAQVVRGDDPRLTASAGGLPRSARTSNTALVKGDLGTLIDITSGTFTQTFVAAATLGNGWRCRHGAHDVCATHSNNRGRGACLCMRIQTTGARPV